MSKKICIAQSVEELDFIIKNINYPIVCLPLNLETQLYCVKNKLQFYNPLDFIDNTFYEDALMSSEKLIRELNCENLKFESHIIEYKAFIRNEAY